MNRRCHSQCRCSGQRSRIRHDYAPIGSIVEVVAVDPGMDSAIVDCWNAERSRRHLSSQHLMDVDPKEWEWFTTETRERKRCQDVLKSRKSTKEERHKAREELHRHNGAVVVVKVGLGVVSSSGSSSSSSIRSSGSSGSSNRSRV